MNVFKILGRTFSSKENWYTNCLALLLDDAELSPEILGEILGKNSKEVKSWGKLKVSQYSPLYSTSRSSNPDLVLENSTAKVCVVIEDKVDDDLRLDQIKRYKKQIEQKKNDQYNTSFVLLSERRDETFDKFVDRHLIWRELYQILSEVRTRLESRNEYLDSFLEYLLSRGMAPPQGLAKDQGTAWKKYEDFRHTTNFILDQIQNALTKSHPEYQFNQDGSSFDSSDSSYIGRNLFLETKFKKMFGVWFGFGQEFQEDSEPYVSISLWFYPRVVYDEVLDNRFKSERERWLRNIRGRKDDDGTEWSTEDGDYNSYVGKWKYLSAIIDYNEKIEVQIDRIREFFVTALNQIKEAGTSEFMRKPLAAYRARAKRKG